MEIELKNLKGTRDYLPTEQQIRNKIRNTLETVFHRYGYRPLETPILCLFDILASKYAGGTEILKEVYRLQDQGKRELALRYDLTVPFTRVIGMNPNLRMPFKRYEIGKVFRDGPVKAGRLREFMQCDVDIVGVRSAMAEAEMMSIAFDAFDELGLDIYISYNNRKFLTGVLGNIGLTEDQVNEAVISLDKVEKIGEEGVREELAGKGIHQTLIGKIFTIFRQGEKPDFYSSFSSDTLTQEGLAELNELGNYLEALDLTSRSVFNPLLARGLEIYTGTVFEVFLSSRAITSSIGGGGRYDKIIGGFLESGEEYPATGISFGLDVIYTALGLKSDSIGIQPIADFFLIPLGTEKETLQVAQRLRKMGFNVEVEMSGKRLKRSLDYANKEGIPFVLILGENELQQNKIALKNMEDGKEERISLAELENNITVFTGADLKKKF
jgi:histidyl-tRNA synthetase